VSVRLLVTRPEPDAERTATALRERGHTVVVASLLHIEPVERAEIGPGPFAAILATSANAATAMVRHPRLVQLRELPVFAVGERSAEAMRGAGFGDVTSANGGVGDLLQLVGDRIRRPAPLLYLAGADRSGDLAGTLSARGFAISTVVVYRAVAAETLPAAAVMALADGIDGVLHFSRRSAEAYAKVSQAAGLGDRALKRPTHFCMSAQIAQPLMQAGAADIHVAPEPTEAALLALIPPP
jgi:uroporphyrinogen-III synthase